MIAADIRLSPWLLLTKPGGERLLYHAYGCWTAAERAIIEYEQHPERGTLVRVSATDATRLQTEGVLRLTFMALE